MVNLLSTQMQVIDFVIGLRIELAIITNRLNSANLNKIKEMAKNMKSTSLINKNILAASIILVVIEVKKLKVQILKLKVELKESKYVPKEDYKLLQILKEIGNLYIRDLIINL